VVEEARRAVEQELDFENERENMEFYRRLAGDALEIVIPSVEAELSSRTLLVMEEVAALKASQLEGEAVRKQATDNLVRAFFQQLFHFGFFHADPHASNVFFTPDGRVVFLDWGLVGRLSWKMRFKLSEFLEALVWGDPGWVVDCSLELSGEMEVEDREGLEKEILELLDRFRGQVLKKVNLGRLSIRIFEILGRYRIRVNPYYLVMGRALMNLEGVVRELDPEFDLLSRTRRYLVQVNRERLRPQRLLAVLRRNFYQTATLLEGLPTRLNNIIGKLEQGRLTLVYQHTGLEKVIQTLKVITDRLVIGMILAALIIGSSLIIFTGVKPLLFGYPVLGLLGYLVSALLGLWIIYISIRDRKK
jgi:ubiquinone biosynthesis protein